MGNSNTTDSDHASALSEAYQGYLKDGPRAGVAPCLTSEALLVDDPELITGIQQYIRDSMDVASISDEDWSKIISSNKHVMPEPSGDVTPEAEKAMAGINASLTSGFKTAQCNIEDLGSPPFEKYFALPSDHEASAKFQKLQRDKAQLLYGLYVVRLKSTGKSEESFAEYLKKFLNEAPSQAASQTQTSIQASFGFVLSLLREMRTFNGGSLLVKSLEHFLRTLKEQKPPSMQAEKGATGEKLQRAFLLEARLNEARAFLLELIDDQRSDKLVVSLACKNLLMLGRMRHNLEDFLIVMSILQRKDPAFAIDLRDELRILQAQSGQQSAVIAAGGKFEPGTPSDVGEAIKMPIISHGPRTLRVAQSSDSWVQDGDHFFAMISGTGLLKLASGADGSMPGNVVAINADLAKSRASLMLLDGKLYMRHADEKEAPFVLVNRSTLCVEKLEPEITFDEKDTAPSLKWVEKGDEEGGRSQGYTPLITDGSFLYTISTNKLSSKPREKCSKGFALESFEGRVPPKHAAKSVSTVTALVCASCGRNMKEGETLLHSSESLEDYCGDCRYLPVEADGAAVDLVYRKLEDGRQLSEPLLMVERYDPSNGFKFEKSVALRVKERLGYKAFKLGAGNSAGDIQKAQWATNGTVLICFPGGSEAVFFSLESGDRLCSKTVQEGLKSYDPYRHRFISISDSRGMRYRAFKFEDFPRPTSKNDVKKPGADEIARELFGPEDSQAERETAVDLFDQLILGAPNTPSASKPAAGGPELAPARLHSLSRAFILGFLSGYCLNFQAELQIANQSSDRAGDKATKQLRIFRYPMVTYLTTATFRRLGEGLDECSSLILQPDDKLKGSEVHSILSLLELVKANFEALNFCQIPLSVLLSNKAEYEQFMKSFFGCISELSDPKRETPKAQEGRIGLWQRIHSIAKEISAGSMRLLHKSTSDILNLMKTSLRAGEGSKVIVQINHLAEVEQLRSIVSGQDQQEQHIVSLVEALNAVVELDQKALAASLGSIKMVPPEGEQRREESGDPLGAACQKFIINASQELVTHYVQLLENSPREKPGESVTEASKKAQEEIKKFERTVGTVAAFCFTGLAESYEKVVAALVEFCSAKKEESEWEGAAENYKKFSAETSRVLGAKNALYQVVMAFTQAFLLLQPPAPTIRAIIYKGLSRISTTCGAFYTNWRKYGKHLGLGEEITAAASSSCVDNTLEKLVEKLFRHVSWYQGHTAYNLILIKEKETEKEKKEEDKSDEEKKKGEKKKRKEEAHKEVLQMVVSSNLLSGGIEDAHLPLFGQATKDQLTEFAQLAGDGKYIAGLEGKASCSEEDTLQSVITKGKNADIDAALACLQKIIETARPRLPYASLGGENGFKLTRSAFAVMIKFSDLLGDFEGLVDDVALTEEKLRVQMIKDTSAYSTIVRRWESAARMRQWINETKLDLSLKFEKKVGEELKKKKELDKAEADKQAAEEEAKKAEAEEPANADQAEEGPAKAEAEPKDEGKEAEKGKEGEAEQIDSSSKPAEDKKEDPEKPKDGERGEKEDEAEGQKEEGFTAEEKTYIEDEAYNRLERRLEEIFLKIQSKAQHLVRLNTPPGFKKDDATKDGEGQLILLKQPSYQGAQAPKAKLDWQARLKSWKQMQTSKGAIRSLSERKNEIWDSGITSILALLQAPIEARDIQKQVETRAIEACRRAAGLKLLRDLILLDMPTPQFLDLAAWFCSALRQNSVKLSHYLDNTKGQGLHLETQSKRAFFDIIGACVKRLKQAKDHSEIKALLGAIKWKYVARDHADLANLGVFQVLHKGNGNKDCMLRGAWGRRVAYDCKAADAQSISQDVLEIFEQLFLTVAARIVEPDFGSAMKLSRGPNSGSAPVLQKAKSVIDENASEKLLGQAFDIIFKEFERYMSIMRRFKGADWSVYVRKRNHERKEEETPLKIGDGYDGPLLDDIEMAAEEEERKKAAEKAEAEKAEKEESKEEAASTEGGNPPVEEPKPEEKAEKKEEAEATKVVPDGTYKARWEDDGAVSEVFEVKDGKFSLRGTGYTLESVDNTTRFGWGDGTLQEASEIKSDGTIVWNVLNNAAHKQITWLKEEAPEKKEAGEEDKKKLEDEESKKLEELDQKNKEEILQQSKAREEREMKQLGQLYSEAFLKRLLRLVEIFTSIATHSSHPLSMVQRVANPYHLSSLLNLLIVSSPQVQIVVVKILQSMVQIAVPFEVFEEAIRVLTRDPNSLAHHILYGLKPQATFDGSMFMKFLFNYLLSLRRKMWSSTDAGSEGLYAVSRAVAAMLRTISSTHSQAQNQTWGQLLMKETRAALLGIDKLQIEEADAFFSLVAGGEYGAITAGDPALTSSDEVVSILGYSSTWKPSEALLAGKSNGEIEEIIKKLRLCPELTDPKQKAVALFYNKNAKERQEMMLLHPSSLTSLPGLDSDEALEVAKSSLLMDTAIVKHLIEVLAGSKAEDSDLAGLRLKQSQILKVLCNQIDVMGKQYIQFLQKENHLVPLMGYLYKDVENLGKEGSSDKSEVIPLKWLECKIHNMRKEAIESSRNLSLEKEDVKVFLLNNKELIFKRTNPQTKDITRTNAHLTSAVNLHKVKAGTPYACVSSKDVNELNQHGQPAVKQNLVMMEFDELKDLNERALRILNSSDAILTTQAADLDVKGLFRKLVEVYKADASLIESGKKPKYENIMETVIFFVAGEDFERCSKPVDIKPTTSQIDGQSKLARFLADMKEWGGLDSNDILPDLQKEDIQDIGVVMGKVEELLTEKQAREQKIQDETKVLQKAGDKAGLKKLEDAEAERKSKRLEVIKQKTAEFFDAQKSAEKPAASGLTDGSVAPPPAFDEYTKDEAWWKELEDVVTKKMSAKQSGDGGEKEAKQKNDEEMTKLLCSVSQEFDAEKLPFEHARSIDLMQIALRKSCLLGVIRKGDYEEVLPSLLATTEAQQSFSKFLRVQYNAAVIEWLQVGQKKNYKMLKETITDVFGFCEKSANSVIGKFIKEFFIKDILRAGVDAVKDFRASKVKKLTEFFNAEEKAVHGLNPYLLRFITGYLIKKDSSLLLETRDCLPNLINMHILCVFYFQDNKPLVRKLLKTSLRLVHYVFAKVQESSDERVGALAGLLTQIVQNKLLKKVTSGIDYKDETASGGSGHRLSDQQLLFLELHLKIDGLQEAAEARGVHIGKVLVDSEAISEVKRNKKILQESDDFDVLRYLYHLEQLEDHQRELMNLRIETSHPAFDTKNRAYVEIPQVQRLDIKFKDSMVLKDLTFVGIGNDPAKDVQLKSVREKEFKWAAGSFYLFYPVYKQCVVAFGKNESSRLSSTLDGGFKTPAICKIDAPEDTKFTPVAVYGGGSYSISKGKQGELYETGDLPSCGTISEFKKMSLKEKVRLISVAPQSVVLVLEDNTIWYKGGSEDYHFPNDEGKGSNTQWKLWAEKEKEEKIVDLASGSAFTLFVTESGNVWASGNRFLQAIGQDSKEAIQLTLPKGTKAKRAWATTSPEHPVAFLELEDEAGAKAIYSAGKSEKGLLGQDNKVVESSQFKKIKYPSTGLVYETLDIGLDSAMAIDSTGHLWGWGYNENHRLGLSDISENGIHRPQEIYPLNELGLKAKKVSCGSLHSLVLFENDKGKQTLWSIGNKSGSEYAHLGAPEDKVGDDEKPFREIQIFSDRVVADFKAHAAASIVVIEGPESPQEDLYNHVLPDGKKAKGLLHLYKKGDQWQYVTEEEYEAKKSELPDLCFALRCPIEDIPSKEWPDLTALAKEVVDDQISSQEVVHEGFRDSKTEENVKGPLYYCRTLINHEEIEVSHSERTVKVEDIHSLNPLIYIRVAKALKKGAKLPSIALEKFYPQDSRHGIDIEIVPDLTYEKNSALIKATQEVWDENLEADSKFLPEYKKDLLVKIDDKIGKIFSESSEKREQPDLINMDKDVKVNEIEFSDKGLQNLSERAKKQRACLYWMLNKIFFKILPYSCRLIKDIPGSAYAAVQGTKASLLGSMKNKFIEQEIAKLPTGSRGTVKIKRQQAMTFRDAGKCDYNGEHTIFGQIFQANKRKPHAEAFRMNGTDAQIWEVLMAGEGSMDVGGPFRECLCNCAEELQSDCLPILVKTPNHRNDHGMNRECFTLNPSSTTPTQQDMFTYFGYLLGFSIRTKSPLDFHFPSLFWKQLLGEAVDLSDLRGVDEYTWQVLKDLKNNGETAPPDFFDAAVDETFTTRLSNGQLVDLCEGGAERQVNHSNHLEFIDLVVKARLAESAKQMEWVRRGVTFVIDLSVLAFLTWEEIETRACGRKDIEIPDLKAITEYTYCSEDHKMIKWFWSMFDKFTQEQRRKYLKFAWGRSKLPADTSQLRYRHQLCYYSDKPKDSFPEAHTCFFQVDFSDYSSEEKMTERVTTAIDLCGEIDGDYSADDIPDADADNRAGLYGGYGDEEE